MSINGKKVLIHDFFSAAYLVTMTITLFDKWPIGLRMH